MKNRTKFKEHEDNNSISFYNSDYYEKLTAIAYWVAYGNLGLVLHNTRVLLVLLVIQNGSLTVLF